MTRSTYERLRVCRDQAPAIKVTRPDERPKGCSLHLILPLATPLCTMSETRLAFKAGRAFRRGTTNFVDPEPTKGAIILQNGEDGLLHFIWKNRSSNIVGEVRHTGLPVNR